MVSVDRLLLFAATSLLFLLIPGPGILFVVGRALAYGRSTALASVAGNTLGLFVLAVAVALGLGPLVQRSAIVFTVVKLVGGIYLVYLGVRAIRERRSLRTALDGVAERGHRRSLWEGFTAGVTNPKTLVYFAAVLPQFTTPSDGPVPVQMILLGLIFCILVLIGDSAWGLVAATARDWFARSPRRLAAVGGVGGLMMIGLGVTVASTGQKR